MKALEFQGLLTPERTIAVPATVAEQIPSQASVRIIVLFDEPDEEREWIRAGNEQFLKGYAESDNIYDQLSGR